MSNRPCSSSVKGDASTAECSRWCGSPPNNPLDEGGDGEGADGEEGEDDEDAFDPQTAVGAASEGAAVSMSHDSTLAGACSLCWCRACVACSAGHTAPPLLAPLGVAAAPLACALGGQLLLLRVEGSEFEARVLLGAWKGGASLNVTFGGQKKILVDAVRGATVVGGRAAEPMASVELRLGFVLDADPPPLGPPRSIWFRARVRSGFTYDTTVPPPTFSCNVDLSPSPPVPPPAPRPPPYTAPSPSPSPPPLPMAPAPPPASTCSLGLAFILDLSWTAGFKASVMVATWVPGAVVRLELGASAGGFSISTVKNAKTGQCDLRTPRDGGDGLGSSTLRLCEFILGAAPDDKHSFGFVAHGTGAIEPRTLSCDGAGYGGPSPASSTAWYPPFPPLSAGLDEPTRLALAACRMGATLSILNVWTGGFRAAVRILHWVPRATLTLRFHPTADAASAGLHPIQLLTVYAATASRAAEDGAITFRLGDTPDAEYKGLGFTARGAPPVQSALFACAGVTAAMLISPPPPPNCILGADFAYVDSWGSGFEAEVSVRSWRGGARFVLDFGPLALPPLEVLSMWRAVLDPSAAAAAAGPSDLEHSGGPSAKHASAAASTAGTSVVVVRLVPEPEGKHDAAYASFKLTARFTGAAVPAVAGSSLGRPTISCNIAHSPPPPPRPGQDAMGQDASAFASLDSTGWAPPEQPAAPRLVRSSCASLEVEWTAPAAHGHPIEEYRLLSSRPGIPMRTVGEGLTLTRKELTGLLASTTYTLAVQARGPAGWSRVSERMYASTEPAMRLPATPYGVPKPAGTAAAAAQLRPAVSASTGGGGSLAGSVDETSCEPGVVLTLPELRGGCSGDEWLSVELQRATEPGVWRSAAKHAVTPDVWINSIGTEPLDALTAVYARVVAHNSVGSSTAGARSEPILPHHAVSAAFHPPSVEPISSSSLLIWGPLFGANGEGRQPPPRQADLASHLPSHLLSHHTAFNTARGGGTGDGGPPCRLDEAIRFEVLLRHEGSSTWQTLLQVGDEGAPLPIAVGSTYCHAGCYIKLRALNVRGWEGFSHPSAKVVTPKPPAAIPQNGARVELRMLAPLPPPRMASASQLLQALAQATSLAPSQLSIVEVCSLGLFVTMDVEPSGTGAPGGGAVGGLTVADALSQLVGRRDALEQLPPHLLLDLSFGINRQVMAEGMAAEDPDAMFSEQLLEGAPGGVGAPPTRWAARGRTLGLIALILLGACCWPLLNMALGQLQQWHAARVERRAAAERQKSFLAYAEEGEEEEEVVEMRIGSRANGKGGGGGRAEVSVQRLRTPLALDMDS